MNENECHTLTVKQLLPCGHHLSITSAVLGVDENPAWVLEEAKKLEWWLTDRVGRHNCSLVSEANPNSITPKEK